MTQLGTELAERRARLQGELSGGLGKLLAEGRQLARDELDRVVEPRTDPVAAGLDARTQPGDTLVEAVLGQQVVLAQVVLGGTRALEAEDSEAHGDVARIACPPCQGSSEGTHLVGDLVCHLVGARHGSTPFVASWPRPARTGKVMYNCI